VNTTPAGEPGRDGDRVVLAVRSAPDLSGARTAVVNCATAANIAADRAHKIALAVSEIATNALVHAASTAHLEIITTPQWFVVKVSDHGPGLTTEPLGELPAPGQERGRGLWLAEQLCDRVEVTSGTDGAHVSLYLRR
jgi:anti-sigma regulatory factor (Ser/Thr protein kinase)